MLKKYRHNPPHLFLDNQVYFITAACHEKQPFLRNAEIKAFLRETLFDFAERVDWQMDNWVILDNHYHFSIKSKLGKDLSYLMGNVHRKTAKYIREHVDVAIPTVWWNYCDYCPRNEADYFKHLNYMLYNPVRHGYAIDLKEYSWSSFHSLFEEVGSERLARQFRQYGYRDLRIDFEEDDDF